MMMLHAKPLTPDPYPLPVPTWIIFIRGINVGGRHLVPMKQLARDLEDTLGCANVRTYIQSGNVVLDSTMRSSAKVGDAIADVIEARHGFRPRVLALSASELKKAIIANPYPDADPGRMSYSFLAAKPKRPDLAALAALKRDLESFELIDRVFYLHAPEGFARSKLAQRVEKHLGVEATARNARTVARVWEMANDG